MGFSMIVSARALVVEKILNASGSATFAGINPQRIRTTSRSPSSGLDQMMG
jgi:hypothetical protein